MAFLGAHLLISLYRGLSFWRWSKITFSRYQLATTTASFPATQRGEDYIQRFALSRMDLVEVGLVSLALEVAQFHFTFIIPSTRPLRTVVNTIQLPLVPLQVIRHARNLVLAPEMPLGVGQQRPPLRQRFLVKRADGQGDARPGLVAPEQEAAALAAEAARDPRRSAERLERVLGRVFERRERYAMEAREERARVLATLPALAGCGLDGGHVY